MSIQAHGSRYVPHLRISDEHRTHLVAELVDPGSDLAINTTKKAYSEAGHEAVHADHRLHPPVSRPIVVPPETPETVHITIQVIGESYRIRFHENGAILDELQYTTVELGLDDENNADEKEADSEDSDLLDW
jgi:hypothetical protein